MFETLNRNVISNRYRDLLIARGGSEIASTVHTNLLKDLPPYLCRSLSRHQQNIEIPKSLPSLYSGHSDSRLINFSVRGYSLKICTEALGNDVISDLKLQGFKIKNPSERIMREIELALSDLEETYAEAWRTITQFTSMILWMSPTDSVSPKDLFACSSFHEFPHCTILTDLALRHIPANIIFSINSTYALQENLFHESLHQKLCQILETCSLLITDERIVHSVKIHVPWRKTEWSLEKTLHAFFVYVHLLEMRQHVLKSNKSDPALNERLLNGISEAKMASSILGQQLLKCADFLSPLGREFTRELVERNHRSIEK